MEKIEIYEKLNKNIQDLEIIENEISMMELAIYQKTIEKLKENKINELKEFFEQQARYYNQKSDKYEKEIDRNIEIYEKEIEKLINSYDSLYINVFKIMQTAINNQKIAIANIVTTTHRMQKDNLSDMEKQAVQNIIIDCAQKKLDYAIVVDECKARIKWCIENVEKDINEIFRNNIYQMQLYKENIVSRIRRMIFNALSGRNKYKEFLINYENEYLSDVKTKNNLKVLDIIATLKGIVKQMEETRKQICKSA